MQRLEVSGAVRTIYGSLGVKRLTGVYYHSDNNLFVYKLCKCRETTYSYLKTGLLMMFTKIITVK